MSRPAAHSTHKMFTPNSLPPDSNASRRLRAKLVSNWWTEAEVIETLGVDIPALHGLRNQRGLIAAWYLPEQAYRYPPFQFQDHRVAPQIGLLMDYLKVLDGANGWMEVEWLYACHSLLVGRRPADVFITEPDLVVAVARREFIDEQDSGW